MMTLNLTKREWRVVTRALLTQEFWDDESSNLLAKILDALKTSNIQAALKTP